MERRDFLKRAGLATAATLLTSGSTLAFDEAKDIRPGNIPRWYGFNLLAKFSGNQPNRKYDEEDFALMQELGFNFARLPMSYWNWSKPEVDKWMDINEKIFLDVDQAVNFGHQYNVHINMNLHRIPGYCINGRGLEPIDLFYGPEKDKALEAAIYHWRYITRRYKGIPNRRLSFDLLNEPPVTPNENYARVVRALVEAIREEDSKRLIFADGINVGRDPVPEIADLGLVQSCRGYDPMQVSHYRASWVPGYTPDSWPKPSWPFTDKNGKTWNKEVLRKEKIDPWRSLMKKGVNVHVGEWGCYKYTPHEICLSWMEDFLSLWREMGWGWSLWNLKGDFGIFNSGRKDVKYEKFRGNLLDRKMLELLQKYRS